MVTIVKAQQLIAAAAISLTYSCAGRQTGVHVTSLREGLYAVVSRTCEGPQQAKQDCARTHYIELVRGKFYGIPADRLGLAEWMALNPSTGPYTYRARPLRGHSHDASRYVIDAGKDSENEARESFLLTNDIPVEYQYQRQPSTPSNGARSFIQLQLEPVLRDAILAERLPYPSPVSDD